MFMIASKEKDMVFAPEVKDMVNAMAIEQIMDTVTFGSHIAVM